MMNVNLQENPKGWCFLQLYTLCQQSRAISDSTSMNLKNSNLDLEAATGLLTDKFIHIFYASLNISQLLKE